MGPIVVDQAPQIAPPQPLSPKLQASESSPSFSMLFASVEVHSPGDSDNDDSFAYNSDSSSHYGSPALANSELNARTESVHISVALAPPLTDEGLQDPMIYEAVTGVYDWQPVPKKHTNLTALGSVAASSAMGIGLCGIEWQAGRGCSASFNCNRFGSGLEASFKGCFGC
ncbi:hypothetical protein OIU78_001102 [Salix suchowensis]|nr:hypothetical protein OIU78_001102 [Salix suchowensis]